MKEKRLKSKKKFLSNANDVSLHAERMGKNPLNLISVGKAFFPSPPVFSHFILTASYCVPVWEGLHFLWCIFFPSLLEITWAVYFNWESYSRTRYRCEGREHAHARRRRTKKFFFPSFQNRCWWRLRDSEVRGNPLQMQILSLVILYLIPFPSSCLPHSFFPSLHSHLLRPWFKSLIFKEKCSPFPILIFMQTLYIQAVHVATWRASNAWERHTKK